MKKNVFLLTAVLFLSQFNSNGQSTFEQVHALFQAKCTGACHSGSLPSGLLDLSGTTADVYNRLVNVAPTNPSAASSGYKRVVPGYPYRSLLMKKVNHGLDPMNELTISEGNPMPGYGSSDTLAKAEIELIRQWIIWGAKDTGTTYNSALINAYYANPVNPETTAPLTPAQEGRQGYQVKFGPIFLEPHGEFEFFQVYNPNLPSSVEITELHSKLPAESHHWALRTITPAGATAMGVAPMAGANFSTQILVYQYTKFMAIWQFTDELTLPEGTAHFQTPSDPLLLNLHMHNYSGTNILAASAYLNVYTQPAGSGAVEMKTGLSSYGGQNPFALNIPHTGLPYTLQNELTSPGETRYFWNIQSHTHQWGKDFDIYKRHGDGTKGEQIYEGFYNENYTANQGYYDYTHPAVRTFTPMMEVNMDSGLIMEATWLNNDSVDIPFALTTAGEMFVTYFSYTNELPAATSIKNVSDENSALHIYPNPSRGNFNLSYTLTGSDEAAIDLYNSVGAKVKTLFSGTQAAGKHAISLNASAENLSAGIYFVHLTVNGAVTVQKIIVLNQ